MAVKPRSKAVNSAPCWCDMRRILAHSIGVRVNATNPEITTAPATAIPNSLSSRPAVPCRNPRGVNTARSEDHTSELQSLTNLVCRLLLEKKNKHKQKRI